MVDLRLVYAPRAQRDLVGLEKRFALQVLDDLELLQRRPWQAGKVKRLRGSEFWEMKTGDYRTIFWPIGSEIVVLRVVDRKDLFRAIERIDVRGLTEWMRHRAR